MTMKLLAVPLAAAALASLASGQVITEILDSSGDGVHEMHSPWDIVVDEVGNAYVSAVASDNVFRVAPDGTVTQVLDASGDGQGNLLDRPRGLAVHGRDLYVAGESTNNVFRIASDGTIEQVLDATGDGVHPFDDAWGIYVDDAGNLYATGRGSNNVFRRAPDGTITQIIDGTGDGVHELWDPIRVLAAPSGNVYVSDYELYQIFRVTPDGGVTRILGPDDGPHGFAPAAHMAVDSQENLYVPSTWTCSFFRVALDGTITELLGLPSCLGQNTTMLPISVAVDVHDTVYVSTGGNIPNSPHGYQDVRRLHPVSGWMDPVLFSRYGAGNTLLEGPPLLNPVALTVDSLGNVYVVGWDSENAFKIELCGALDPAASSTPRNGSGTNPTGLSEATPALIGGPWRLSVDDPGGLLASVLLIAGSAMPGTSTPLGELLCTSLFALDTVGLGPSPRQHEVPIPYDCSLIGRSLCAQAAVVRFSPLRVQLQNAIDAVIGSY